MALQTVFYTAGIISFTIAGIAVVRICRQLEPLMAELRKYLPKLPKLIQSIDTASGDLATVAGRVRSFGDTASALGKLLRPRNEVQDRA